MKLATVANNDHGNINGKIFYFASLVVDDDNGLRNEVLMMAVLLDPNTLMYHKEMQVDAQQEFISEMGKEWHDQLANSNLSILTKDTIPEGATVVPSVWVFKRKQDIRTWGIKKH